MITEDLYLQVNYLKQASSSLEYFKDKGGYLFNMRCPFCGDSQKSRTKARGYCFRSPVDGLMMFKCHNCNKTCGFRAFLKFVDSGLYNRYWFQVFKDSKPGMAEKFEDVMKLDTRTKLERQIEGLKCTNVTKLSRLHPVNAYIKDRMIPTDKRQLLYYTENFEEFCTSMQNYSDVPADARLLLFETDKFGNLKLVVARSLEEYSKMRYVTLRIDEHYPKAYGYSRIDNSKDTFVVEGAIDSLFLDNSVATLDSNLDGNIKEAEIARPVYIVDNEPRSKIIVNKLKTLIQRGERVVIFDSKNPYKDINQMVQNGYDIQPYINSRIFKGIKANMEFGKWSKV